MKYKIQDIKLPAKPAGFAAPKKISEKRIVKVESREARDYSWGMWLLAGISVVFLVFSLSLVFLLISLFTLFISGYLIAAFVFELLWPSPAEFLP